MLIGQFLNKNTAYYTESLIFSSLYAKRPLQGKCIFMFLLLDSEKMAEMRYDQYTQKGRQIFFGYGLTADLLAFFFSNYYDPGNIRHGRERVFNDVFLSGNQ